MRVLLSDLDLLLGVFLNEVLDSPPEGCERFGRIQHDEAPGAALIVQL